MSTVNPLAVEFLECLPLSIEEDLDILFEKCNIYSTDDQKILKECLATAKSCILESNYIDKDYRNAYSGYYSKKYTYTNDRAKRIHLFDVEVKREHLEDYESDLASTLTDLSVSNDRPVNLGGTSDGYIGYIVIRPTEYSCIGRTLLDPRKLVSYRTYQIKGCLVSFTADIGGNELCVSAFPHQSQDTEVHTCAHTAIWSLFRYLSQRYSCYIEQYPYDIAMLNQDLHHGRTLPGKGLYMDQIAAMFGNFGLSAEFNTQHEATEELLGRGDSNGWADVLPLIDEHGVQLSEDKQNTDRLLYLLQSYISSAMPPVVGLPHHAVTVTGMVFDTDLKVRREGDIVLRSDFVRGFVVNDDNHAPYKVCFRDSCSPANSRLYACDEIDSMIVPLPEKSFLSAESAEICCTRLANSLGRPTGVSADERFVRNLFCTSSRNYKKFRRKQTIDGFTDLIVNLPLPHFLWITEFTCLSDWANDGAGGVVEIALDATAGKNDESPYIWIRYPDYLAVNWPRIYGHLDGKLPVIPYEVEEMLTFSRYSGNLGSYIYDKNT